MKKIYFIFFLLSLGAGPLRASHLVGGEIRYEYTGTGNIYKVYLTLYTTCSFQLGGPANVDFTSINLAQTFTRAIPPTSTDTLNNMYCAGFVNSCTSATSLYPGFIANNYADTVTLLPSIDWKMVWTSCCRPASVANISNPSAAGLWLEALLNNQVGGDNNSAWIPNSPPFLIGSNGITTIPANIIDADGDSVVYYFITPQQTGGAPVPYAAGYSQIQPMGAGSLFLVDNTNHTLHLQNGTIGNYALAMRMKEYRNGILKGYTARDWNTTVLTGDSLNPPVPTTTSMANLNVVTCPGQNHTLSFSFGNGIPTDSIFVAFIPPANGIPITTSYSSGLGSGSGTISWVTPPSLNPFLTPYFFIKIFVRNNACVRSYAWYAIKVKTQLCTNAAIWPGDANDDNVVDLYDPLAIALAYGQTGPARTAPTINWIAQSCANWNLYFNNGANMKHADCDGNGAVDNADLGAVTANYGLTHPKGLFQHMAKTTGLPDLYFDHAGINAFPGAAVSLPIKLGNSAMPMNNMYGLAATVTISGITPGSSSITYPVSWLGTAANTLRFTKAISTNAIDWAYARSDQQNTSGQGALANLDFTIPAGTPVGTKVILTFENVKLIDAAGLEIHAFNNLSDTITVKSTGVALVNTPLAAAMIIPNPSQQSGVLRICLKQDMELGITVTDMAGRMVWNTGAAAKAGTTQTDLPAARLKAGIYMIRITGNGGEYREVLKWVRE